MSLSFDGAWKSGVWALTVWAQDVWFEGGRGRPVRRRKARYGRKIETLVQKISKGDEKDVAKEYAQHIIEQARQIASARIDLEIAQKMMKAGQDKVSRLAVLEAMVEAAEERMAQISDEEDLILILAMTI